MFRMDKFSITKSKSPQMYGKLTDCGAEQKQSIIRMGTIAL